MLKKNNMESIVNKKIPKKTQNFPNVSENLFYTLTKELILTPEQILRKIKKFPSLSGKKSNQFRKTNIIIYNGI